MMNYIKPVSQLQFDYDNDDTTTHSITTEVIEITICIWFDCDTTTMKKLTCSFFARVEWKQACAICRSRIEVESQL